MMVLVFALWFEATRVFLHVASDRKKLQKVVAPVKLAEHLEHQASLIASSIDSHSCATVQR